MGENIRMYNVRKTFEFKLSDGQLIEIKPDDAEWIYDVLKQELTKSPTTIEESPMKRIVREAIIAARKNQDAVAPQTRRKDVPLGFIEIGRRPSQKRVDSDNTHTYVYFKNAAEQYGFLIENHEFFKFRRLGAISDPASILGRIYRQVPKGEIVSKVYFVKKGVYGGNRVLKAVMDILEIEKYLVRRLTSDRRRVEEYIRTNKTVRPEVENDHEPHKVLVSSGQAASQ